MFEALTTFAIRRGAERGLAMEGFVGGASAVSRRFETVKLTGWFSERKVDAATCGSGAAPQIEFYNTIAGCRGGKKVVSRAKLAAAGDGAMIVRFDAYSCSVF